MDHAAAAQTPPEQSSWRRSKWLKNAAWIAGTIAVLYAMVYVDVLLRAREAYMEGEKYWRWSERADEKQAALELEYQNEKAELDKKLAKNKIAKEEYDRRIEIAQFDRDRKLEESAIKYAYVWYKTAFELFSPPESKWVRLSRQKAPLAREKWKEELRAKKIPFEEYMLD